MSADPPPLARHDVFFCPMLLTQQSTLWPTLLDLAALAAVLGAFVVIPAAGYAFMFLDIRAYLRSLRRHLVRIAGPNRSDPDWARKATPRCISALGLELPCTEEDLLGAYRERVKSLHPDRGGDRKRFIKTQRYFEEAVRYLSEEQSRSSDESTAAKNAATPPGRRR